MYKFKSSIVASGRIGANSEEWEILRTPAPEQYGVYVVGWFMGYHKTISDALRWLADTYDNK